MKFLKFVAFFLFTVFCCTSYANSNKYVFVGQNNDNGSIQTAFVLEFLDDTLENHVQVNQDGEIYLKVDRVIPMPKESLSHAVNLGNACICEENITQLQHMSRVDPPLKKWQCPYCYRWWEIGRRCENPACPTNNWDKK